MIVEPIIYQEIKFTALHEKIGYVEALDTKTGSKLWEAGVYKIGYDSSSGKNVRDIFIKKLAIENGSLIVYREDGKKYRLAVTNGEIISSTKHQYPRVFLLVIGIIITIVIFAAWMLL